MKQQECELCLSGGTQTKLLLACLRGRLTKQCQQYVPDYQEEGEDNGQGFSRLLILVFGLTSAHRPSVPRCTHTRISRYFRRKLKCDNPTFNSLCGEVAHQLAKRNYHIQILHTQLRSALATARHQATHPLAEIITQQVYAQTIACLQNKNALRTSVGLNLSQQTLIPLSLPLLVMGEGVLQWSFGSHNLHN